MTTIRRTLKRTSLPVLIVLCLAALTASYAYADGALRPLSTQIIGDPDAAVTGKFAVGTATPGNKALTVVGVIDFLGAGTVHNYFTEGTGNNMQINTNVDEANAVGDAMKSQWKLVLGSALDWFSIRRSPAAGTYNEDALFFIEGSTGRVGIATVDTGNLATIPFTPMARLHVQTASGDAIWGAAMATTGSVVGVYGRSESTSSSGVYGYAAATTGNTYGVMGRTQSDAGVGVGGWAGATTGQGIGALGASYSPSGYGVVGEALSSAGASCGVYGMTFSTSGYGVYGSASATSGTTHGIYGESASTGGTGVDGRATATTGGNVGVFGRSDSTSGFALRGLATATSGSTYGVFAESDSDGGYGVNGYASADAGTTYGVYGRSDSTAGTGVFGTASATSGVTFGVYGRSLSPTGYGVYGYAPTTTGTNYGVYGRTSSPSGYGVYYVGGLAGTGAKSAIVETQHYGWRSLYAMESPQNWFEDFGQATLSDGEARVTIEPIFAETVNLDEPYHVFLTPRGGFCSLYVAETSSSSFTVRAVEGSDCEITFDYRIIAPRLDYEDLRLKPAENPEAVAASVAEAQPPEALAPPEAIAPPAGG
jgi:hypothetical protein